MLFPQNMGQAFKQPAVPVAETRIHDITEKFGRACEALDVGQLVKDEYFTLFESIGAIEIMDPKMDSGFLQPGETLEDTYSPLTPLLPAELLGIMDQLLCHEMAWHTGYPLSQTLFTSIHIDRLLWPEPKVLEHAQFYRGQVDGRPGVLLEVLRAYCLALVKGCDYVIAKVTARDYFEEEDFCTNTYNRVLFVSTPVDVFEREVDVAVELMEDPDLDIDPALRAAIITRLEFRKSLLMAMDIDLPLTHLAPTFPPLFQALPSIKETHGLGKSVPEAFSTKLQRRLASTVPPRPIATLDFPSAYEILHQILADCSEATRFTTLPLDPLEYQAFLWAFSSRTPPPLPYSRSYLATILFHPDILNSPVSLPLEDVKSLSFPSPTTSPILDPRNWTLSPPLNPALPKPLRLQLAMLMDEFVEHVGQPYIDLWVALGQNRCRLRRMLTRVITSWNLLQTEAEMVDRDITQICHDMCVTELIPPSPLTTWVTAKKLWMVEKILLLGFEQDIYLADEYAGMYHYLSHISDKRAALLHSSLSHAQTRTAASLSPDEALELELNRKYISAEYEHATATSALANALHAFYTVLAYLGLLPTSANTAKSARYAFSSDKHRLRYDLRMKPFLNLQPQDVPSFRDFCAAVEPYGPMDHAFVPAALLERLRDPESALWTDMLAAIKTAKDSFAAVRKSGAGVCRTGGVGEVWEAEIKGLVGGCVVLGVGVAVVRDVVGEVLDRDGEVGERLEGGRRVGGQAGDAAVEAKPETKAEAKADDMSEANADGVSASVSKTKQEPDAKSHPDPWLQTLRQTLRVEFPEAGKGRYCEGWIVGKVVRT